jgi:hypothetical protein
MRTARSSISSDRLACNELVHERRDSAIVWASRSAMLRFVPDGTSLITGRLALAFAAAPLMPAAAMYFGFPLFWIFMGHDGHPVDPSQVAGMLATLSGVCGVFVTVVGAVPVFGWLRRRGRVTLRHAVGAGVVLGNVPFALYLLLLILPFTILHLAQGTLSQHLIPLPSLLSSAARVIVLGSVLGAIGALTFWIVGLAGTNAARQES